MSLMKVRDLFASLVVFLVALPLSMGIALASGAPILSGLVSAAIGGIVVGLLAGAPLQVSGPAAGLAVVMFGLNKDYSLAQVGAIVACAGVLQLVFGALRVARLTLAISPAVIHGMLAGIGVLIALGQLHVVLGGTPESSAWKNLIELPQQIVEHHTPATLLGLLTIALLLLWPLVPVKALRRVPGALVAVTVATLAAVWSGADVARVTLPQDLRGAFHLPTLPANLAAALAAALTLAIIASAESLLCAVATDKLHTGPRANLDRELMAQGAGNLVAGLVGGLPITGVIVRSTANIESGGQTRWSAVLHGVWVVVFVTLLGSLLTRIPLSVLAGLLVVVGVKLVNVAHIRALLRHRQGLVYAITLFGVVGVNLLWGIGMGVAAATVELLLRLTRVHLTLERHGDGRYLLRIRGALTFIGVPRLSAKLAEIPTGAQVIIDVQTEVTDHAGFEALHAFRESHQRTGGTVDIDSMPAPEPTGSAPRPRQPTYTPKMPQALFAAPASSTNAAAMEGTR